MMVRAAWVLIGIVLCGAVRAADPESFVHPVRGYMLNVPTGARIGHRSRGADVEIRSDAGWAVVVESQRSDATMGISESAARLEDLYLGSGRPWTRKLDQGASVVAGLPAFDAVYDGFGTRFRVVIARGPANEYLFILRAPPDRFADAMADFRGLLRNFRPGPKDFVGNGETFLRQASVPPSILRLRESPTRLAAGAAPDPEPAPDSERDQVPATPSGNVAAAEEESPETAPEPPEADPEDAAEAVEGGEIAGEEAEKAPTQLAALPPVEAKLAVPEFTEPRLGYRISYMPGWVYEMPSDLSVMFSGADDTDAYWATVSIQNVAPPEAESTMHAVAKIVDQIQAQFAAQAPDVVFDSAGPYVYRREGAFLLGREFFADYDQNGVRFRQWSIVLPRPKGRVAHIWTYRAPAGRFDVYLPIAEAMLRTWTIEDEQRRRG